jgi:mRNA interferase HicA
MKHAQFKRWLAAHGVRFEEGARHTKLYYRGRQPTLPRHSGEIGEGLRKAILIQPGLVESTR